MTYINVLLVEDDKHWEIILQDCIKAALDNLKNKGFIDDYDTNKKNTFYDSYLILTHKKTEYHLLVTEICLGNKDSWGQRLGLQLVENAVKNNILAIAITGKIDLNSEEVRDILKINKADDLFFKKHFSMASFITIVEELLENKLQSSQENNSSTNYDYQLSDYDKQYLIKTLSSLAAREPIGVKAFFRNIVNQLSLPEDWKNDIVGVWTGNANADATTLINWSETKKSYPNESQKSGYNVLGCIAEQLLEKTSDIQLLGIIIRNQLLTDEGKLEELKTKYSNAM